MPISNPPLSIPNQHHRLQQEKYLQNYSILEQKVLDIFFWPVGSVGFLPLKCHPLLSLDD
jgi:hypothetical protein